MSHYEDEAQVQQLRQWWRENWPAIAAGIALGLGGILGWEGWQDWQTRKATEASALYDEMKGHTEADQAAHVAALGERLVRDFSGTPYAAQGALLVAQRAAERGDWAQAQDRLEWVVSHAGDDGLKKIARLRLARVLWQQQQVDAALAQLDGLEEDDAFAPLYLELRGDITLARGDRPAARGLYEQALKLNPAAATRDMLSRKLDDLADAKS